VLVPPGTDREEHRRAYAADVTYGAYTDLIYGDLRDGLAYEVGNLVHRGLGTAIVHGATDVLLDRSREPLRLTTGSGAGRRTVAEIAVGEHLAALADLQAAMWREPARHPLDSYQRRGAELFAELQYLIHRDTLGYCLQATAA
jgi:preprotein translocase subunit SecA